MRGSAIFKKVVMASKQNNYLFKMIAEFSGGLMGKYLSGCGSRAGKILHAQGREFLFDLPDSSTSGPPGFTENILDKVFLGSAYFFVMHVKVRGR